MAAIRGSFPDPTGATVGFGGGEYLHGHIDHNIILIGLKEKTHTARGIVRRE
jgi:hypothetical protein